MVKSKKGGSLARTKKHKGAAGTSSSQKRAQKSAAKKAKSHALAGGRASGGVLAGGSASEESHGEVDEEDLAFFQQYAGHSSFLQDLDNADIQTPSKIERKRKPKVKRDPEADLDDRLTALEQAPRSWGASGQRREPERQGLPIKRPDGTIVQQQAANPAPSAVTGGKGKKKRRRSTGSGSSRSSSSSSGGGGSGSGNGNGVTSVSSTSDIDSGDDDDDDGYDDDDIDASNLSALSDDSAAASDLSSSSDTDSGIALELRRQEMLLDIRTKKEELAKMCSSLVEDPEKHAPLLKNVHELCEDDNPIIQRLALLSMCSVFKDILPSYRIRLPTEKELAQQLSADVKKLLTYEAALLSKYQAFLKTLEHYARNLPGKYTPEKDAVRTTSYIAVKCMCELLVAHPEFNFRSNLMTVIAQRTNARNDAVAKLCCDTVKTVFRGDATGDTALELVRMLAHLIKRQNFHCRTMILETFVGLNLTHAQRASGLTAAKKEQKLSRKKKRKLKAQGIDTELENMIKKKGEEEKQFKQTKILETVFLVYFRVVKKAPRSPLIPTVLRGLSRYAHLINIEFLTDLITALKALVQSHEEQGISPEIAIHCIHATFSVIQGQGQALSVDLKDFHNLFYQTLLRINASREPDICVIVCKCIYMMLISQKQVSISRVAGFVKRLLTLAVTVDTASTLAILHTLARCLQKYPRCGVLLDNDGVASGHYLPLSTDAEFANALATAAWELSLLQRHHHPTVRSLASRLAEGDVDWALDPVKVFHQYNPRRGGFNPPVQAPVLHPLQKRLKKLKDSSSIYLRVNPRHTTYIPADLLTTETRQPLDLPAHLLEPHGAVWPDEEEGGGDEGELQAAVPVDDSRVDWKGIYRAVVKGKGADAVDDDGTRVRMLQDRLGRLRAVLEWYKKKQASASS